MPERRLELLHLAARVPETRASTNSAIRACVMPVPDSDELLDLFVQGMPLQVWIVLFQDQALSGVLFVFRCCVS